MLKDHLIEGEKALDVGSGSGYLTVCMALMVGETGKAVGIDHIEELIEMSTNNVRNDKPELLSSGRVKFVGKDSIKFSPFLAIFFLLFLRLQSNFFTFLKAV